MRGGARGLTYAKTWAGHDGPILCPEGFSDAAVLEALGLTAVGRPSNTGGVDRLAARLADVPPDRAIVVLGEHDKKPDGRWPGKHGAVHTAEQLSRRLGRLVL
jgi:hypothetical protein